MNRSLFFDRLWAELESLGADPDHASREDWEEAAALTWEAMDASQWRPVSEPPEMENRRNLLVESLDVLGCDTQKHQWVVRAWIDPEDGSVRWSGSPHVLTHWRPLPEGPKS